MHESFLTHARNRYLWVAIGLLLLSIGLYVWHDPVGQPSGGSWLGFLFKLVLLGGVCAGGYYGWQEYQRRKRYSGFGGGMGMGGGGGYGMRSAGVSGGFGDYGRKRY